MFFVEKEYLELFHLNLYGVSELSFNSKQSMY